MKNLKGKIRNTAAADGFERKCSSRGRNEPRPRRACSRGRARAGVSTSAFTRLPPTRCFGAASRRDKPARQVVMGLISSYLRRICPIFSGAQRCLHGHFVRRPRRETKPGEVFGLSRSFSLPGDGCLRTTDPGPFVKFPVAGLDEAGSGTIKWDQSNNQQKHREVWFL